MEGTAAADGVPDVRREAKLIMADACEQLLRVLPIEGVFT